MSAALLYRRHGHHEQAHDWFAEPGGAPPLVEATQLLEAGQLSDTYLLALAVHHGGSAALRLIPT